MSAALSDISVSSEQITAIRARAAPLAAFPQSCIDDSAGEADWSYRRPAVILVIAFLALAAPLMFRAPRLLLDTDTYWHIVVGEQIWSTLQFPHYDQFSHTMAGAPWIAKEWLSQ